MRNKVLGVAALICAVGISAVAFSACKKGGNGEISNEQWQALFDVELEKYDSLTILREYGNSYDKSEAEERGEYDLITENYKIDNVNDAIYKKETRVEYLPQSTSADSQRFVTSTSVEYNFKYQGGYYSWSQSGNSARVNEITEEQFASKINDLQGYANVRFKPFSNPAVRAMFNYDAEKDCYNMSDSMGSGSAELSIKIEGDCVTICEKPTSVEYAKDAICDPNRTTVSIPSNVEMDVYGYILNKQFDNNNP